MADDNSSPDPEFMRAEQNEQLSATPAVSMAAAGNLGPAEPDVSATAQPLTLREKHPLATRWMHWLNFPLLSLMIWSGLMIYWADSEAGGMHACA